MEGMKNRLSFICRIFCAWFSVIHCSPCKKHEKKPKQVKKAMIILTVCFTLKIQLSCKMKTKHKGGDYYAESRGYSYQSGLA